MGKSSRQSSKAIQQLLDEKRQLERWLRRLDMAADKTPEGVRSKVRSDYAKRLDGVLRELAGYRDDLDETLEKQQERRAELQRRESEKSEELSEAELRHAVGEYTESEWTKHRTDLLEALVKAREELKQTEEEIDTVKEVMQAFEEGADAARSADEESDQEEAGAVATADDADDDGETDGKKRGGSQTDAFDELAFLKSVTEDKEHGPDDQRASGVQRALRDEDLDAVDEDEDDAPPPPDVGAAGVHAVGEAGERPSKGTSKKSLKCADCGAMNLPTEWYCEKCGAELAAL